MPHNLEIEQLFSVQLVVAFAVLPMQKQEVVEFPSYDMAFHIAGNLEGRQYEPLFSLPEQGLEIYLVGRK